MTAGSTQRASPRRARTATLHAPRRSPLRRLRSQPPHALQPSHGSPQQAAPAPAPRCTAPQAASRLMQMDSSSHGAGTAAAAPAKTTRPTLRNPGGPAYLRRRPLGSASAALTIATACVIVPTTSGAVDASCPAMTRDPALHSAGRPPDKPPSKLAPPLAAQALLPECASPRPCPHPRPLLPLRWSSHPWCKRSSR